VKCIEWKGSLDTAGYGCRWDKKRRKTGLVHRWIWELANGPIPNGLFVLHTCDNRLCYRLSHLKLGTNADNMLDMARKGRACTALSKGQIPGIRWALMLGMSQRTAAALWGVNQSTVSRASRGVLPSYAEVS